MSRKTLNLIKVAIGFLLLVFIGPLVYLCLIVFVLDRRQPTQYLIPNGYVGWIRVEYQIKKAPPLPQRGRYLIAKIPSTGVLRTSSTQGSGWAADEYYYFNSVGIHQRLAVVDSTGIGMVHFGKSKERFIGTKGQLQKIGWSYVGRPGPIKER